MKTKQMATPRKAGLKIFLGIIKFTLSIFAAVLDASAKQKEHEPTTEELISGERIIGSDKFDFPDQKFHK